MWLQQDSNSQLNRLFELMGLHSNSQLHKDFELQTLQGNNYPLYRLLLLTCQWWNRRSLVDTESGTWLLQGSNCQQCTWGTHRLGWCTPLW